MKTPTRPTRRASAALALAAALSAHAAPGEATAWLPTWTAAPQATWRDEFPFPTGLPDVLQDTTLRQVARISLGGTRLRLVLSNAEGRVPLAIGAVHVALAADGDRIVAGSDRVVTFGGAAGAHVPAGAPLVSDPVALALPALARLAVSIHLPGPVAPAGFHWDGRDTAWLASGDRTAAPHLDGATPTGARAFLAGVLVEAPAAAGVVVALGDSITDGNGATPGRDARWPDFLAARLAPRGIAVVNAGISGGRLLSDGMGASALARLDRDVLAQPGVRALLVLIGSNDIAWPGTPFEPDGLRPTAQALLAGYRQLAERAHARGVRVVAGTLPPFEDALAGTPLAAYSTPAAKDALRRRVNDWLRATDVFDAVVDFDAVLRDPAHPARLAPAYDSGDHLHPGDRGNAAMADAVDLGALLGE